MKIRLILSFAFVVAFVLTGFSQGLYFAQYNQTPALLNPALVGNLPNKKLNRFYANYRNQWESTYQTAQVFYERTVPLEQDKIGLGASILHDEAGQFRFSTQTLLLSFAYHKYLSDRHSISFGLSNGITRRKILVLQGSLPNSTNLGGGFDTLVIGQDTFATVGQFQEVEKPQYGLKLNFGLLWTFYQMNDDRWQFGASLYGLSYTVNTSMNTNRAGTSFLYASTIHFHTNYRKKIGQRFGINPTLFLQTIVGFDMYALTIGSDFQFKINKDKPNWLHFGSHYDTNKSLISNLGFRHKGLFLLLSYESNLSKLSSLTPFRHTYEASFGYLF